MSVAPEVNDVTLFLSKAGERYKEHRELLRRKFLEDERQECPFKPTLSKYAAKKKSVDTPEHSDTVEKRLFQLHIRQQELAEERRLASKERERSELEAAMRPPRLSAQARSLSPRNPVEVSRLWLRKREEKLMRMREALLREELESMQLKPSISSYAEEKLTSERRNGQRIEDYLLAQRKARRERVHQRYEGMGALGSEPSSFSSCGSQQAFRPRISDYARRLSLSGSVVDRLLAKKPLKNDAMRDENCTFAPQVTSTSTGLLGCFYRDPNASVYDRLYDRGYKKPTGCSLGSSLSDTEHENFGYPHINETSRAIVEHRRARHDPLLQGGLRRSPTERLYAGKDPASSVSRHKQHCQHLFDELQRREMSQCTFRPHVDEGSEQIWRQRLEQLITTGKVPSIAYARELLWRRSEMRTKEQLRREREFQQRKEVEECTFHPKVGRGPYGRAERELTVSQRNEAWQQRRQCRLNRAREEVERSEISECCFRPSISSLHSVEPVSASEVTGYDLHVQRHEKSRRMDKEKQEWWKPKTRLRGGDQSFHRVRSQPQRGSREWREQAQEDIRGRMARACSVTSCEG